MNLDDLTSLLKDKKWAKQVNKSYRKSVLDYRESLKQIDVIRDQQQKENKLSTF
jgi:hypothetical protein